MTLTAHQLSALRHLATMGASSVRCREIGGATARVLAAHGLVTLETVTSRCWKRGWEIRETIATLTPAGRALV